MSATTPITIPVIPTDEFEIFDPKDKFRSDLSTEGRVLQDFYINAEFREKAIDKSREVHVNENLEFMAELYDLNKEVIAFNALKASLKGIKEKKSVDEKLEKIKGKISLFYNKFIKEGARLEVNIEAKVRKNIEKELFNENPKISLSIFLEALKVVINDLIKHNYTQAFKNVVEGARAARNPVDYFQEVLKGETFKTKLEKKEFDPSFKGALARIFSIGKTNRIGIDQLGPKAKSLLKDIEAMKKLKLDKLISLDKLDKNERDNAIKNVKTFLDGLGDDLFNDPKWNEFWKKQEKNLNFDQLVELKSIILRAYRFAVISRLVEKISKNSSLQKEMGITLQQIGKIGARVQDLNTELAATDELKQARMTFESELDEKIKALKKEFGEKAAEPLIVKLEEKRKAINGYELDDIEMARKFLQGAEQAFRVEARESKENANLRSGKVQRLVGEFERENFTRRMAVVARPDQRVLQTKQQTKPLTRAFEAAAEKQRAAVKSTPVTPVTAAPKTPAAGTSGVVAGQKQPPTVQSDASSKSGKHKPHK